jgi:hypothetical protein
MEERFVNSTPEEVERLRSAELAAQQRYDEAMKRSDMSAARIAADDWLKASDALTEYVAKHPDPYRGGGG